MDYEVVRNEAYSDSNERFVRVANSPTFSGEKAKSRANAFAKAVNAANPNNPRKAVVQRAV
jgi:hypothetical protein